MGAGRTRVSRVGRARQTMQSDRLGSTRTADRQPASEAGPSTPPTVLMAPWSRFVLQGLRCPGGGSPLRLRDAPERSGPPDAPRSRGRRHACRNGADPGPAVRLRRVSRPGWLDGGRWMGARGDLSAGSTRSDPSRSRRLRGLRPGFRIPPGAALGDAGWGARDHCVGVRVRGRSSGGARPPVGERLAAVGDVSVPRRIPPCSPP